MVLIPNAKQSQQEISWRVDTILILNPNLSPEEALREATLQVLAPLLERLLVPLKMNRVGPMKQP